MEHPPFLSNVFGGLATGQPFQADAFNESADRVRGRELLWR